MLRLSVKPGPALSLALAGCVPVEPPPPSPPPAQSYRALGTEPFWTLRLEANGRWTLTRLDFPDARGRWAGALPLRLAPTASGESDAGVFLTLTTAPGPCSDGMSDRLYEDHAHVAHGTIGLTGCGGAVVSR